MALRAEHILNQPQKPAPRLRLVTEEAPASVPTVNDSIAFERGYSEIHMMALANSVPGIKRAWSAGASLECRTTFDETPLMVGVDAERMESTLFLLSIGARPEARSAFRKLTSLMSASINGSVDLICLLGFYLKEHGKASHVNAQDLNGNTALHWAVEEGTRGAINSLRYIGADNEITNNDGLTPEAYAKALGRNAMAKACRKTDVAMPMIRNARIRALFYSRRGEIFLPSAAHYEQPPAKVVARLRPAPRAKLRMAPAANQVAAIG